MYTLTNMECKVYHIYMYTLTNMECKVYHI